MNTGALGPNGWLHLSFTDDAADASWSAAGGTVQAGTIGGLAGWSGLPTTGFVVKQRNVGSVSGNYASSMDHGYRRTCDGANWAVPGNCPAVLAIDPN